MSPSHGLSRLAVVLILVAIVVLLPIQISKLSDLLSLKSPYRAGFVPLKRKSHIMVTGFVNNKEKLENLYRELFNEGRCSDFGPDFQVLILGKSEPKEDVINFLISRTVDGRMIYRIGDVMSSDDMARLSCEMAMAVFFLCDVSLSGKKAMHADIEVVLNTIAVESINGEIETLSQMILHENRDLIFETDVDVILTFQDYKATMMARNAMNPGMATLLEGLITSSTILATKKGSSTEQIFTTWQLEYFASCDKEVYLFRLDHNLLERFSYRWPLLVEAIYTKYGYICLGVCDNVKMSMVLNPTPFEMNPHGGPESFFKRFNYGVLVSDTQIAANTVASLCEDVNEINSMIRLMFEDEIKVPCCHNEDGSEGDFICSYAKEDEFENVLSLHSGMESDIAKVGVLYKRDIANTAFLNRFYENAPNYDSYRRDRSSKAARNKNYLECVKELEEVRPGTQGHAIFIGAKDELPHILREFRRPLIKGERRRQIIIFGPEHPSKFSKVFIKEHVENVFWVPGSTVVLENIHKLSHKLQLESAFSVSIMSADLFGVDHHNDQEETINTDHGDLVLFYLQLQNNLPSTVFFSCYFENTHKLSLLDLKIGDYIRKHRKLQREKDEEDADLEDESDKRSFVLRKNGFGSEDGSASYYQKDGRVGKKEKYSFHNSWRKDQNLEHEQLTAKLKRHSSEQFWDFSRSPSSLSIVASGKAFASQSFDALLVQCFLSPVSARLFESLAQGQQYQSLFQIKIPNVFVGRPFKDLFRVMLSRNILVLSLYRATSETNYARFPFVVTGPSELYWKDKEFGYISTEAKKAILHIDDKVFVYTNPDLLTFVLNDIDAALARKSESSFEEMEQNLPSDSDMSNKTRVWVNPRKASISPTQEVNHDVGMVPSGGRKSSTAVYEQIDRASIPNISMTTDTQENSVDMSNMHSSSSDPNDVPKIPKAAYSAIPSEEMTAAGDDSHDDRDDVENVNLGEDIL